MRPVRWGALIATGVSAVIAGCSASPPPEVPAPPVPPAPVAQSETKVEARHPVMGAFSQLFENETPKTAPLTPQFITSYSRGSFAYIEFVAEGGDENVRCPVAHVSQSACQFYRFADNDGAWGEMKTSPHRWGAFAQGKDVIYARRVAPMLAIDAIDEKGEARPFYQDDGVELSRFEVLELVGGKKTLVGFSASDNKMRLIGVPERPGTHGDVNKLQLTVAPPWAQAAWTRERIASGDKVAMSAWAAAALRTAAGEPEATGVLVWVEAIPPAKYSPRDGKSGLDFRSKHGCGGPPSRPLTDGSVTKKLHLMRISAQGKVLEDKTPALSQKFFGDHAHDLSLQVFDGGFEVGGLRFSNTFAQQTSSEHRTKLPQKRAKDPFVGQMPPNLVGAAFDAASGEGIVIIREGETQSAQLIDASGRPKGSAWPLAVTSSLPSLSQRFLAKVGDTWVALDKNRSLFVLLTGKNAGKEIQMDWMLSNGGIPLAILPDGDRRARVVLSSFGPPREISLVGVELSQLTETSMLTSSTRFFTGNDGESIDVFPYGNELMFVGWRQAGAPWRGRMKADGSWTEEPMEMSEDLGGIRAVTIHSTYRDKVVVLEGDNGTEATWASTGQRVSLSLPQRGEPARPEWFWNQSSGNGGSFLRSSAWVLPGKASDVVSTGEDASLIDGCSQAIPTAERSVLLVCAEPQEAGKIGGRIGTRVYSF